MRNEAVILNNTLKNKFTMVEAKEVDTKRVQSLLVETAEWFQKNGSTQWRELLEGSDTHNTAAAIKRGDVFISKVDEHVAAMVMLLQNPSEWDRKLWGLANDDENDSIYLHRLTVSRKYSNEGLGKALLDWCRHNIEFQHKTKIRLDCMGSNEVLNRFYKNAGFTYIGQKDGFSLYEVNLS